MSLEPQPTFEGMPYTRLQGVQDFFVGQDENPTPKNPDAATAAMYKCVAQRVMAGDSALLRASRYLLTTHDEAHPVVVANHMYKILTALAAPDQIDSPEDLRPLTQMTTAEEWDELIDSIVDDETMELRFIAYAGLPINSNISGRGELLMATALLHGIEAPNKVIELGSSLNLILKRAALKRRDPLMQYDETIVMNRPPRQDDKYPAVNLELSQNYNQLLRASRFILNRGVGVDLFDPRRDNLVKNWGIICSHYIGELLDPTENERFFRLLNTDVPEVDFVWADATEPLPEEAGEAAEITYIPTMLYQLPEADVRQVLKTAEACTVEDGLIIVQDKVRMLPNGGAYFFKRWDWNYRVWVKRNRPKEKFELNFTADGGRVNAVVVEPGAKTAPMAAEYGLSD